MVVTVPVPAASVVRPDTVGRGVARRGRDGSTDAVDHAGDGADVAEGHRDQASADPGRLRQLERSIRVHRRVRVEEAVDAAAPDLVRGHGRRDLVGRVPRAGRALPRALSGTSYGISFWKKIVLPRCCRSTGPRTSGSARRTARWRGRRCRSPRRRSRRC